MPDLERILHQSLQAGGAEAGIEPDCAERMQNLTEAAQRQERKGQTPAGTDPGVLRNTLSRFVRNAIPNLRILSVPVSLVHVPLNRHPRATSSPICVALDSSKYHNGSATRLLSLTNGLWLFDTPIYGMLSIWRISLCLLPSRSIHFNHTSY